MRNLKKVLALVLALVMSLSLVTIANADFTDASAIGDEEAVTVMSALGIIEGNEDGSFNPTGTLTREQAAKIIAYILLGPTAADKLGGVTAFKDVPANRWSAGYISYCASLDIIAGNGDGTFNPTGKLTGYAFAKMLLTALGYDASIEGYVGAGWQVNVAAKVVKLKLNDGIDNALSNELTREEACRMALNAMSTVTVGYQSKGSTVSTGDTVVEIGNTAADTTYGSGLLYKTAYDKAVDKWGHDLVGISNGEVGKEGAVSAATLTSNDFGQPSREYKINGETYKFAEAPVLTYTTGVKGTELASDIDKAGYEFKENTAVAYSRNGGTGSYSYGEITTALESSNKIGGNGVVLELYANEDGEINKIVAVVTYLGEITAVVKDKASTSADERELKVSAAGKTLTLTAKTTDGFDEIFDNAKVEDKVLVTPNGDNSKSTTSLTIAVPETVTGMATAKNTSKGTITLDGTVYEAAATIDSTNNVANFGVSSKYEATLYLDPCGYVVYAKAGAAATSDKAVAVLKAYQTLNSDGELVSMIQGVTSNGETVAWETNVLNTGNVNKVCTYTEKDDVYTLTPAANTTASDGATIKIAKLGSEITKATKSLTVDSKSAYFTSTVKFIFVNDGKAVVQDGVQKVAKDTEVYVTLKLDGTTWYITGVYALTTASNSTTTSDGVVLVASGETGDVVVTNSTTGKDESFKSYDAYINGEKVDNFYAKSGAAVGFYYVEVDDETGAYVLTNNSYSATTGDLAVAVSAEFTGYASGSNIMTAGGKDFGTTGAILVDTTDNDISSLAEIADLDADSKTVQVCVIYDADTNNASYIYVTSVA